MHGSFRVVEIDHWDTLREQLQAASPAMVAVVDPFLDRLPGSGPAPELRELLRTFPSATVVAAVNGRPTSPRDLWTLGTWGIAEILQVDEEGTTEAIRRRLREARGQPLRSLLFGDLPVPLPGRARVILDASIEVVSNGGLPRDLAQSLGLSPSTLLRWCQRSHLPTPRRLLLWMRSLLAASLLDDPGHSVLSVALACGYSSDQAQRRALRAVAPYTPTQLREQGAFATLSAAFLDELERYQP